MSNISFSEGRWRIRRALAVAGLRAQQPRPFVPRTISSDPNVRAAPNLLLGQPAPSASNWVWVGDITYLPKEGGGSTWPLGSTATRAKLWAGTCLSPCLKLWSARSCAAPWPGASRPGWSSIPTRVVNTAPLILRP